MSTGVGGRSGGEKSNDERSPAETRGHGDGDNGDKKLFEGSDKFDDDDADSDKSEESMIVTEQYIHQFRQQVHQTAKSKGLSIIFINNAPLSETPISLPAFSSIPEQPQESVEVFHGCGIDFSPNPLASAQRLHMTLSSFLEHSPIIQNMSGIQKRSYLSTEAAIYYSNSHTYARLWPIIKTVLSCYRELDSMPRECSLIAVGRIPPRTITGEENDLLVAQIPQNNPNLAANISCPIGAIR